MHFNSFYSWINLLICALISLSVTNSYAIQPCQNQKKFKDIQSKLENSDGIGAWQKIAKEIQERIAVLEAREEENELSCGYYLLAQSYFYISALVPKEAYYSYKGISALYQSEYYQQGILEDEQGRQRLDEFWDRLSMNFKEIQWLNTNHRELLKIYGASSFNQSKKLYLLEIQAVKPFDLQIALPSDLQKEWPNRCGLSLECQKPLAWQFKLKANQKLILPIKPGKYELNFSGNCVQTPIVQNYEFPSTQLFELPNMTCQSKIEVSDDLSQTILDEIWVNGEKKLGDLVGLENTELDLSHPAYQSISKIKVPSDGSDLKITLKRCELYIDWHIIPKDAVLNGPKKLAWGVEQEYEVSRQGYITQKPKITLAQPRSCDQKEYQEIELSRAFQVEAMNEDQQIVNQYALKIGQIPVISLEKQINQENAQKQITPLQKRVGTYSFEAVSPLYEPVYGSFSIRPCDQQVCPVPKLSLQFIPKEHRQLDALDAVKLTGVISTTLGLIIGAFAYQNYQDYNDNLDQSVYEQSKGQADHISTQKNISMALVGIGMTTIASAYIWPLFSSSKEKKNE